MATDYSLLQMALVGYKAQRQMIDEKIADIQNMLGNGAAHPTNDGTGMTTGQRRPMSAAAKRRIAAAQKKRWKAFRAKQKKAK
jgi:hypothetical protein